MLHFATRYCSWGAMNSSARVALRAFGFAGVLAMLAATFGACSGSGEGTDAGADATGPSCGSGSMLCGSSCVALATDNANCGACGKACKAGEVCSQGACATTCGGGTSQCGSTCNDTQVDPNNCGACGTKCVAGQVCSSGKCVATCASNEQLCGSSCVDEQTDNVNCGGCGTICGSGTACSAGKCVLTCQQGLTLCAQPSGTDAGVDASTDAATDAAPDAATDSGDAATDAGDAGFVLTYPYCANLQSDDANCGGCGLQCAEGFSCVSGACAVTFPVTQSMMVGTPYACNNTPPEYSGAPCGTGVPGFAWTDTTNKTPTSISVMVDAFWNCNGATTTPRDVLLNGTKVGTILPGGDCVCQPGDFPRTVAFTSTAPFLPGQTNTVTFPFISTANCEAYAANPAWNNAYGFVSLTE